MSIISVSYRPSADHFTVVSTCYQRVAMPCRWNHAISHPAHPTSTRARGEMGQCFWCFIGYWMPLNVQFDPFGSFLTPFDSSKSYAIKHGIDFHLYVCLSLVLVDLRFGPVAVGHDWLGSNGTALGGKYWRGNQRSWINIKENSTKIKHSWTKSS